MGRYVAAMVLARPGLRIVVITHRVFLVKKALERDFPGLGFRAYDEFPKGEPVVGPRIIITVDSLARIPDGERYDLVLGDEVLGSTLQHSSDTVKAPGVTAKRAFNLCVRAANVGFMDAAADCTPVLLVVEAMRRRRRQAGLPDGVAWLRSDFVRPTPPGQAAKNAVVFIADVYVPNRTELVMQAAAIEEATTAMGDGENVYVCCSFKPTADAVHSALHGAFPERKLVLYTRETSDEEKAAAMRDANAAWGDKHAVIATSTIESGCSFEVPSHFNRVIAILANSPGGPTVYSGIQMGFRVRGMAAPARLSYYVSDPHNALHSRGATMPSLGGLAARLDAHVNGMRALAGCEPAAARHKGVKALADVSVASVCEAGIESYRLNKAGSSYAYVMAAEFAHKYSEVL